MKKILDALRGDAPLDARQAAIHNATRGIVIHDPVHGPMHVARTVPIAGCRLRGCDLSDLNLSRVPMTGATLRGCACARTRFAHLRGCQLEDVTAREATFLRLSDCTFARADLSAADIGPLIAGCAFSDVCLAGAHIWPVAREQRDTPQCCTFDRCVLSRCTAAGCNLGGSRFTAVRLDSARLTRAVLRACEWRDVDLRGANLLGAALDGARFAQVNLDGAIVTPRQARELEARGVSAAHARVVSIRVPDGAAALARALAGCQDYTWKWHMIHPDGRRDRILIHSDRATVPLVAGAAFRGAGLDTADAASGEPRPEYHDCYDMDGPRELGALLSDIISDYVDWRPDPGSLDLSDADNRPLPAIAPLARAVLEQFSGALGVGR